MASCLFAGGKVFLDGVAVGRVFKHRGVVFASLADSPVGVGFASKFAAVKAVRAAADPAFAARVMASAA